MSISKQITLKCDVCFGDSDEAHWTAAEARRVAREEGWRRRTIGGRLLDVCPECAGSVSDDTP